jgi:serine/threonine protein kinase
METTDDSPLVAGSIFQGGYEILAELAQGSFGRVYEARQLSTGQRVAIKTQRGVWRDPADFANARERFRREMRLCAELAHPNIVRLIDSGETPEGRLYAVFEYVPGFTLKDVLSAEGKLSLGETLHLMSQVLDALSAAHARGIVHRDLKPANIMITKTGGRRNALVLDFGLSGLFQRFPDRELPKLTASYELMGTPCYAAPEQLRGEAP